MALKCLVVLALLAYCHAGHSRERHSGERHSGERWMGSHGPSMGHRGQCGPQVLPQHIDEPRESAAGYSLRRNDCTYKPGSRINIVLSQEGDQPIEQLHLYARHEGDDSQHTVGAFSPCSRDMQVMNDQCIRNNDIITQMETITKDVHLTWLAPEKKFEQKPIYFVAVIKRLDGEIAHVRTATIMPEMSQFFDSDEDDSSSEESGSSSSKSSGSKSRGGKGSKGKKGSKGDDDDSWEKHHDMPPPAYPHEEPGMPPPHMGPGGQRPDEPAPLPDRDPGFAAPLETEEEIRVLTAGWAKDFMDGLQEEDLDKWMESTDEERQSWFEEWAQDFMSELSDQHQEWFERWARKFKEELVDSKHINQYMEWANAFKDHVSDLGEDQLLNWILSSANERSHTFREWAGMFKQELDNPEHLDIFEQWMEKFEEKLSEHPEWFAELERKYLSTLSEEELRGWTQLGDDVQKQRMEEWMGQLKEQFDDEEPDEWLKDLMRRFQGDKDDDDWDRSMEDDDHRKRSREEDDDEDSRERHDWVGDGDSREKHHDRGGEDYSDSAELMEMMEAMYQRHSRWEEHNQEQNMCPETATYLKAGKAYWIDDDEDEDDYECWKMAVLIGIVVMLMAVCGSLCYLAMRRRRMAMMEMKNDKPHLAFENDLYTLSPGNLKSDAKPPVFTQVAEPMEKKVPLE